MAIMKDLTQIKKKLIENVREYQDTIKLNKKNRIDCNDQINNEEKFNAAKYLFISTGLSNLYPDIKESKIIAQFSTPWPKQSYCRVEDVSKQYSKKFSALTRSASILIIFFAGQFLNMPSGLQDLIIHVVNTTAVGYVVLLHIQLYQLFPALVILPVCIIIIVVHFIITSGKADAQLRLAKLFPVSSTDKNGNNTKEPTNLSSESGANIHQSRRASLQLGLNVIEEIQEKIKMISLGSSVGSDVDDDESDESCDDDEDDGEDDDDDNNCCSDFDSTNNDVMDDSATSDNDGTIIWGDDESMTTFDIYDSHESVGNCGHDTNDNIEEYSDLANQNNVNSDYSSFASINYESE